MYSMYMSSRIAIEFVNGAKNCWRLKVGLLNTNNITYLFIRYSVQPYAQNKETELKQQQQE